MRAQVQSAHLCAPRATACLMTRWFIVRLPGLALMLAPGVWLGGCAPAPPESLSLLFPQPTAEQIKAAEAHGHRPRRPPYKPPVPVAEDVGPEPPPPPDWDAIYASLPRNEDGQVDWDKALAEKLIEPKSGLTADAKEEEPTDLDVELVPKGQPEFKAVFSHKVHTSWLGCANCHTSLFEMEHGKTEITMDKINAGGACGVCHGKVAAPDLTACPACHVAMGK